MFERLLGKKQETPQQTPVVIKRVAKVRRGKKSRIAAVLTEADYKAFKKIGNVPQAHAQLGISKGVLYMWNKLGTWDNVIAFKEIRAQEAKAKLHISHAHKVIRHNTLKWLQPTPKAFKEKQKSIPKEFPTHTYLVEMVKQQKETNKLLATFLNEIKSLSK